MYNFLFQDKGTHVQHVESRKSRHVDKEYDVYLDVELLKSKIPDVKESLKTVVCSLTVSEVTRAAPIPAMKKTVSLDKGETKCKVKFEMLKLFWIIF